MAQLFSQRGFSGSIKITPDEFSRFKELVYNLAGIFLQDNRAFMVENRFSHRLTELGFKTYTEYINFLKNGVKGKAEEINMLELITTNETSFFRDGPQLDAFRNYTLKELIDIGNKTGRRELRIWSAGCSSGEEPYTLSIILHETLKNDFNKWRIRITANDISTNVLNLAKRGVYTKYALRATPQNIISKYFKQLDDNVFEVKPEVKKLVSFGKINLNDERAVRVIPRSQVVFCRNVIIYFDREMKKKVLNGFYSNLLDDGHLYVGHSESLHLITKDFRAKQHRGAISYRKVQAQTTIP
ncbi:protein-glutamate O-methyltransferase CheR [Maridesulfovibrio sp.]|uniref:CheR family methyltransferase n=1 Tax=Maridesulfovibrio sp. TaxID=2795000 RepID=UPI002A189E50|nr:protein-glutamate O-methyltransferase CheR [Maridesulfovibrio sp.]